MSGPPHQSSRAFWLLAYTDLVIDDDWLIVGHFGWFGST
jgi:hypothetical protein